MSHPSQPDHSRRTGSHRCFLSHWHENIRLMVVLLVIWFVVSYLFGIVLVEPMNQFQLEGFPLGFWFAQQGSIFVFIAVTFVYALGMDRIDRRHGVQDGPGSGHSNNSSETPE